MTEKRRIKNALLVRLDDERSEQLRQLAKEKSTTRTSIVRILIAEGLAKWLRRKT